MTAAVIPGAVPGEDVPVVAPMGLAILGLAAALGAGQLASATWEPHGTSPDPASLAAPANAPADPPAPIAPLATSTPSTPEPREATCPRLLVGFAWSSHVPPEAARAPVGRLSSWLRAHPAATVVVDGHADGFGSDYANLDLSRRRAGSVAHLLEVGGVARSRLTVRGFGAFSPAEGRTEEAAENRRVVVQVRGGEGCPFEKEEVAQP